MTHSITQQVSKALHFFYDAMVSTLSIPLKLIEKIKTLFASKVVSSAVSPAPTPLTEKIVEEKKQPLTQDQAAIKIQCWFRNKLSSLDHPVIATILQNTKAKIAAAKAASPDALTLKKTIEDARQEGKTQIKQARANSVYTHKTEEAKTLLQSSAKATSNAQWEKVKVFAKSLSPDYYVFAHGSSTEHGHLADLRTQLDSPTLFPALSSTWNTRKKLRSSSMELPPFKDVSEYFKSDLCQKINTNKTTDDQNRSLIFSCDGHLDNKGSMESAFYFFDTNSNIFKPDTQFVSSLFKDHIDNSSICRYAEAFYSEYNTNLPLYTKGRVYLIAIPKKEVEDLKTCYIWRSYPFGKVAPAPTHGDKSPVSDKEIQEYHTSFIEILKDHQKGTPIFLNGTYLQYRMLSHNLDKDPLKKVLTIEAPSSTVETKNQQLVWKLGLLLKQTKRLESITKETSPEELASILLRTRFSLDTFFMEGNFNPKPKGPKPIKTTPQPSFFKRCVDRITAAARYVFSFFTKIFSYFFKPNTFYYVKGIQEILQSKKNILMAHQSYLQKHLPASTLTELKKIGIDLAVSTTQAG